MMTRERDGQPIKRAACWRIWHILQECCGAGNDGSMFVGTMSRDCVEYRFCGSLGFGGKFWNANGLWYVTCYFENETPERLAQIAAANERLSKLKTHYDLENQSPEVMG